MKVLVTGADGLLGSNLVRELLDHDFSVRVFIQPGSKSKTLEDLPLETSSGDLLGDEDSLKEAMSGCDAAFHCAAITDQWADPDLVWKVNLEGTRKVLDACLAAGVKKLVFVGSASSYRFGTMDKPGDETGPFPDQYRGIAYMESKHKASELVREYVRDKGLDAVIVAPTFLMGPYDARPSSGELVRQFIIRGLKFTSPGGRNFVYAGDAAQAMVSALTKGRAGESYIMGGENLTYMDFFGKVAKIAGMDPPKIILPRGAILFGGAMGSLIGKITGRPVKINLNIAKLSLFGTYYSPAKAVKELDMLQTSIDKAIRESIESLKEYGHLRK
jgi:dihydroflavonol-4-reductase